MLPPACRVMTDDFNKTKTTMEKKRIELRRLLEAVEKELLKKPRRETLDHLALFAGYQNWEGFLDALHGDSEGLSNYNPEARGDGEGE